MQKKDFLYEGKAKQIYTTEEPGLAIMDFKDDATAFDGKKKGSIKDKGSLNAGITTVFFQLLEEQGIPTHFKEMLSSTELLVEQVEILQVEVVVRNLVAGSLSKRIGLEEGHQLEETIVEFYYKDDDLGDPLLNRDHIKVLGLAEPEELDQMKEYGLKVNEILSAFMKERGVLLVDFKLEFGRSDRGLLLADEISPDTCRFWDSESMEKLDKDRFRRDLGGVEEAYQEILERIQDN